MAPPSGPTNSRYPSSSYPGARGNSYPREEDGGYPSYPGFK